ncbi:ketopantoate reductase family protein [Crenalkalicoccus roseus]|uniref:ketopantoate reductase family protein n=1 Tax=Crenalkalicoccus roseus TaxID=1485588 RepID=UPI001081F969|nr:2-dehydropantoate 2-reductase [Crenalkalicoccus roseus]
MRLRLVFVGAGAVGGYVGGHLARLGHDVTLVDAWPAHVEAIRARGLALSGLTEAENVTVEVPAMHVTEVQGIAKQRPVDIAFVSVKSYDTPWATHLIAPYLSETGFVVSLQNGINEETIAGIVGWGRTVGMIAATLSVELHEPGRIRRTVPLGGLGGQAVFGVGEVHGRVTPRAERLGAMLGGIDTVKVTTNLWGERWTKLCVNAMRNGISAATGLSGNDCDRDARLRRFAIRVGAEGVRIGQALGYSLEAIQRIPPEVLARAGEGDAAALDMAEGTILATANAGKRSDLQRPSMGQDMRKGRRTEIDFLNGHIVREGARAGLPAPANAALVEAVKRVERGEVEARPENVAGINL